jgi:hypothetical protein
MGFEEKYNLLSKDIGDYNSFVMKYQKQTERSGYKMLQVTTLPLGLYVFLFPAIPVAWWIGGSSLAKMLEICLPLPIILSLSNLSLWFKKTKTLLKSFDKEYYNRYLKRFVDIMYPECEYFHDSCSSLIFPVLPKGRVTVIGKLQVKESLIQIFEVSVDRSAIQGKKGWVNQFHGIVCVLGGFNEQEAQALGNALVNKGRDYILGRVDGTYVMSVDDVAFVQFMSHYYKKTDYSHDNPYRYRPIDEDEFRVNYSVMRKIIDSVRR